ncbi:ATP-binding protein [Psychrosphaera algicola]|uniref:histidine kinase n=1 Tax=Psychrosphaera algicola TaxID=3023714 RepID=A0ABT5FEL0_9GAMM|nr:ATP-binding protein [Psychrosphaera sp. G1-22]MDC2889397.1 ATP-binding protein [Psychrosphaera sp. G1-22]
MRLQQKSLLVTLPLILIPTIILGWLSFHYTKDAQVQIENAKLQADVTYRSNAMQNYINNAKSALQFISSSGDIKMLRTRVVRDLPYSLAQEFIVESFETFATAYPDTESIVLFTKDLEPIFGYANPAIQLNIDDVRLTLSDQVWRLISKQNEAPKIEIQLPLIATGEDIEDGDAHWGYVQLILKPSWLELFDLPKDKTSSSFIVSDLQGKLLFTYPYNNVGTTLPSQLFERLLDSARKLQSSDINDGSQKVFFTGKIMDARYLLLYGMSESNVRHHESNITLLTVMIVLISVVIAPMLLFYVFSRHVIQPIEKLANAKQQVAQGMLDVKLEVPNNDELGELFAAFNVMVRQLVVYRENERESRLRLEYKVKERTEELEKTNYALANSNRDLEVAKQISEQANDLKSAFVANISHEIRTPLTAILGFTEQVIADMPSSKYQMDLLTRVLKSGKHLLALINDILDLSKIESEKLELEVSEFDMFELFNDVISILSSQAADKDLEFQFNQHFPLPRLVRTDATRLRQVLLNLASNAIKFTAEGFIHIDVRYIQQTKLIEVTVSDSGIGMSADVQQRIFTPFVQADVSISRRFGGTGLGLVISKSLTHLLGGDIRVFSEEEKGSEFVMNFALSLDNDEFETPLINNLEELAEVTPSCDLHENKPKANAGTSEKMVGRVLVAEDVEDNQYLFGLLLQSVNVDFVMVENGEQAVEKALIEDFDLILMDMQMPIMGGIEATQLLRQAGVDTPVYALTANVMREDIDRHLKAGCNGTIAKPVEKQEFFKVLQRHLAADRETEPEFVLPEAQMKSLRENYLTQLVSQCSLIKTLIHDQDLAGLRSEFHKVKGAAGSYGFVELGAAASVCEVTAKEHLALDICDWTILTNEFGDFVQLVEAVLANNSVQS